MPVLLFTIYTQRGLNLLTRRSCSIRYATHDRHSKIITVPSISGTIYTLCWLRKAYQGFFRLFKKTRNTSQWFHIIMTYNCYHNYQLMRYYWSQCYWNLPISLTDLKRKKSLALRRQVRQTFVYWLWDPYAWKMYFRFSMRYTHTYQMKNLDTTILPRQVGQTL